MFLSRARICVLFQGEREIVGRAHLTCVRSKMASNNALGDIEARALADARLFERAVACVVRGDFDAFAICWVQIVEPRSAEARLRANHDLLGRCCMHGVSVDTVHVLVSKHGVCTSPAATLSAPVIVNGNTVVHAAACHGRADLLRYFVEQLHIAPDATNVYGVTPLMTAVRHNHLDAVRYLIEDARVEMRGCSRSLALLNACAYQVHVIVAYLTAVGAGREMGLSSERGLFIAQALVNQTTISVMRLDLHKNSFRDNVALALAECLPRTRLRELYLSSNLIGSAGVFALLCTAADPNSPLHVLDLSCNPGTVRGFAQATSPAETGDYILTFSNSSLRELRLLEWGNTSTPAGFSLANLMRQLLQALRGSAITHLQLSERPLLQLHASDALCPALAQTRVSTLPLPSPCTIARLSSCAHAILQYNGAQALGHWCHERAALYPFVVRECARTLLLLLHRNRTCAHARTRAAAVRVSPVVLVHIMRWITCGTYGWASCAATDNAHSARLACQV